MLFIAEGKSNLLLARLVTLRHTVDRFIFYFYHYRKLSPVAIFTSIIEYLKDDQLMLYDGQVRNIRDFSK